MKQLLFVLSLLLVTGCAGGPVLYPNAHIQQVGAARAQQDVAECEALAEQYVHSDAGIAAAKTTAIGGASGAVVGGAVGAVTGDFGRSVGVGAAAGAATGLVHGIIQASEPSPVFKNFMTRCLQERGYEVIGWE